MEQPPPPAGDSANHTAAASLHAAPSLSQALPAVAAPPMSPFLPSTVSLLPGPPVTTSIGVPLSLVASLSPPLPATPVIAALSVSSASLSSSLSSSSSPPSSEELSSTSSGHSNGSSSGASGSSTQSEQSAHRARAVYAENAYVALLRDIEALSSQVQPPSPLAPTVPAVLTVALSETVQKAQEGWKKITKHRKKTRKRVSRGLERALKKEGMAAAQPSGAEPRLQSPAGLRERSSEEKSSGGGKGGERKLDSGGGSASREAASKRKQAMAGKRKIRQMALPSSTVSHASVPGLDGAVDAHSDDEEEKDEDNAVQGDDEGSGHTPDSDEKVPASPVPPPVLALPSTAVPAASPPVPPHSLPVVLSSSSQSSPLTSSAYDSQAPVVMSCSKFPIAVLHVPVQRQYTMTRKDSKRIKREEKEALVNVSVRIMGTPEASFLYFVAKDVCQLICLRKGSVAKAIHDFSAAEKARMPVMCQRSSGSGCTQVLTVLTVAGVQRLMNASRQPIAKSVLQWIMEKIHEIQTEKKAGADAIGAGNTVTQPPSLTSPSSSHEQHSAAGMHRPPSQLEGHIPQMDGLSAASSSSARLPHSLRDPTTPLHVSMLAPNTALLQPSAFQSELSSSSSNVFNSSGPVRSGGELHSPSRHPFSGGGNLLPPQYLNPSALSSFSQLSNPHFSTLPSYPSSFNVNVLQSDSSSRSGSQFPHTPPFSSFSPATPTASLSSVSSLAPFHHQAQLPQQSQAGTSMQQQSQQLLDALQAAHSQSLSLRYNPMSSSPMTSSSQSSSYAMAAMFGLQAAGGAGSVHSQQPQPQQASQQQQQQQQQMQSQQPLLYPLLSHLRLPQPQPPPPRQ